MNYYDIEHRFEVNVDPGRVVGRIKPLNGVNNAPYSHGRTDLLHYLREANIPSSRLHDTGGAYGGYRYVDVDNIFRDFDRDETDPANYDFAATDHLLTNLAAQGLAIVYRLGCSIENDPLGVVYRIYPPRDFAKWARICEHIIRHYNEGWANGFRLGITHWEIWNEPDNEPVLNENPMWRGTMEQFFELYRITANHLKACFPELRIGGYGSCGFYSVVAREAAPEAHISPRTAYFTEFFLKFLDYISAPATRAPLDFFSWHSYADENACVRFAEFARAALDSHGFTETESIFDEWNVGTAQRGTLKDASDIASMLITMHAAPVDQMMYYDGQYIFSYGGLFSSMDYRPLPAYYAMKAFGELYAEGTQIHAESPAPALKLLASRHRLLMVNRLPEPVYLTLHLAPAANAPAPHFTTLRVSDNTHALAEVNWDRAHIPLPPYGLALAALD